MIRRITNYVCFALILASLLSISPAPVEAGGNGDFPPPGTGDWIITTDTEVWNETILLKGNLTVEYGATLTFRNVTLIMDSEVGGTTIEEFYHIEVKRGGAMKIFDWDGDNTTTGDASNITLNNTNAYYWFWVRDGSNFTMRNSELHNCGGGPAYRGAAGLTINTNNASIDRNLISKNYYGIVLNHSDALISNNSISWNEHTGIFATWYSNGTIENNLISWNNDSFGIHITGVDNMKNYGSNPLVRNNRITDTGCNIPGNPAVGIGIETGSNPLIKDTVVLRSTEDNVFVQGSTPTLINVTLDGANFGISSSSTEYIYVINSTIRNTNIDDLFIAGNPGSYFVLTNTTFNENKVDIDDNNSNLTVKWYLHVKAQDSLFSPISGANVRIKDNDNGTYDENYSTNLNGYVRWIVLKEYLQTSSTKVDYTPHNITVDYTGLTFLNNPRDSTMDQSKTEVFTATTTVPEFPSIVFPVTIILVVVIVLMKHKKRK